MRRLLPFLLLLPVLGCWGPRETPSAIVAFAEAHGSGDLAAASIPSIRLWAARHKPLALQIAGMCRVLPAGDATWADTTEGRLCLSIHGAAFSQYAQVGTQ